MTSSESALFRQRGPSYAYPLALAALTLALFWPAFFYGFANYDDLDTITSNPLVRDLSLNGIGRIFTFFSLQSYYPVRLLSMAVEYALWGPSPQGYHVVNVFIHLLSILLLYALFLRVSRESGVEDAGARPMAFAGAAFFGLHPVIVDSVAWICGREELLMLLFLLSALHLHISARKSRGPARLLLFVLTAYAAAFSCLANVLGVTAPLLAILYEAVIARNRRPLSMLRVTWPLWLISAAAFFIKLVSLGILDPNSKSVLFPYVPDALRNAGNLIEKSYVTQALTLDLAERLRLVVSLFGANVLQVFFPARLPVMYENTYPPAFLSAAVFLGFAAAAATAVLVFRCRRERLVIFGVLWFLASLLPSAQIVPHHIWRADRFLYLPLAGLALASARLSALPEKALKRRAAGLFLWLWIAILSARAAAHLPVWSDAENLHRFCVAQSPGYFLVHRYLGAELARQRRFDEAIPHLVEAVRLAPNRGDLWITAIKAFMEAGRKAGALEFAREGVKARPRDATRYNDLAVLLGQMKRYPEALVQLDKALALDPKSDVYAYNRASCLMEMGRRDEAFAGFQHALALNPDNPYALYHTGLELEARGRLPEAIEIYRRAVRRVPGYLPPRRRLAALLGRTAPPGPAEGEP